MFKLCVYDVISRNRGYRLFCNPEIPCRRLTTPAVCRGLRGQYKKIVLSSGLVWAGTLTTWGTCRGSSVLSEDDRRGLDAWGKWFWNSYQDNIVNSSTLRFGRAAFTVSTAFIRTSLCRIIFPHFVCAKMRNFRLYLIFVHLPHLKNFCTISCKIVFCFSA